MKHQGDDQQAGGRNGQWRIRQGEKYARQLQRQGRADKESKPKLAAHSFPNQRKCVVIVVEFIEVLKETFHLLLPAEEAYLTIVSTRPAHPGFEGWTSDSCSAAVFDCLA